MGLRKQVLQHAALRWNYVRSWITPSIEIGAVVTGSTADEAGWSERAGLSPTVELLIPVGLLSTAALGWWWSARMADDMTSMPADGSMGGMTSMSMAAFVVGWVAMMAAMMFPAIAPMVRLYSRAATRGRVAPVPFFVAGYLLVWGAIGVPSYGAWRVLADPLAEGAPWVGRVAGTVFVVAAIYQLTPLKSACLTHCRSPISFFIRRAGTTTDTPWRAIRLGANHGGFCLGCCWAIMAVLVALGTMNLAWMLALTLVIFVEKVSPRGEQFAAVVAAGFAVVGVVLLVAPSSITTIT